MTARPAFLVGSDHDRMLTAVEASLRRLGTEARRMRLRDFAGLVDLRVDGSDVAVAPEGALLARPDLEPAPDREADFLGFELRSQLEAFSAMSSRPVVNRSSREPLFPVPAVTAVLSPQLAERLRPHLVEERFVSDLDGEDGDWDAQDLSTHRACRLSPSAPAGRPYRLRRSHAGETRYDTVAIVGERAWVAGGAETSDEIVCLSTELAGELALDFCAITWRVRVSDGALALALIDQHPHPSSLGQTEQSVADALAAFLSS